MKTIDEYINEKNDDTRWIAIEVTTEPDHYHPKETRSQRVVSYDTYLELKSGNNRRGYMKVKYVDALGPTCKTKQQAMEFLTTKSTQRKSKINKGDADYIVWCISSGKMNPSGKTKWDWSIWEEWKDAKIYIDKYGDSFLMGAEGSLKIGDKVYCVDNDSQKKLSGAPYEIGAVCDCDLEAFRACYREHFVNKCKRPSRQFGKFSDGLPWSKMGQFYSIKGVAEEA